MMSQEEAANSVRIQNKANDAIALFLIIIGFFCVFLLYLLIKYGFAVWLCQGVIG